MLLALIVFSLCINSIIVSPMHVMFWKLVNEGTRVQGLGSRSIVISVLASWLLFISAIEQALSLFTIFLLLFLFLASLTGQAQKVNKKLRFLHPLSNYTGHSHCICHPTDIYTGRHRQTLLTDQCPCCAAQQDKLCSGWAQQLCSFFVNYFSFVHFYPSAAVVAGVSEICRDTVKAQCQALIFQISVVKKKTGCKWLLSCWIGNPAQNKKCQCAYVHLLPNVHFQWLTTTDRMTERLIAPLARTLNLQPFSVAQLMNLNICR